MKNKLLKLFASILTVVMLMSAVPCNSAVLNSVFSMGTIAEAAVSYTKLEISGTDSLSFELTRKDGTKEKYVAASITNLMGDPSGIGGKLTTTSGKVFDYFVSWYTEEVNDHILIDRNRDQMLTINGIDSNVIQNNTWIKKAVDKEYGKWMPEVNNIELDDVTLNHKESAQLKPVLSMSGKPKYEIQYESSNPKVATVDENGNIQTKKQGKTTVTCYVINPDGCMIKGECDVTVKYTTVQWIIVILLFGWIWY